MGILDCMGIWGEALWKIYLQQSSEGSEKQVLSAWGRQEAEAPGRKRGVCGLWRIGHLITWARLASISPVIPTDPFPGSAIGLCPGKFHARPHAAGHLLGFPLENFSRSLGIE